MRIYDKSVKVESAQAYADSFASFRTQIRTGSVVIPVVPSGPPLDAECSHFLDCIEGKAEPLNDGRCGLRVVRALEAASQSMSSRSLLTSINRTSAVWRRAA